MLWLHGPKYFQMGPQKKQQLRSRRNWSTCSSKRRVRAFLKVIELIQFELLFSDYG